MSSLLHADSWLYTWVLIPLLILVFRVMDQTLGTLRVVFVARGFRHLAPVVGFFESIIWLLAVSQILNHVSNPVSYLAYGGGYAIGSFFGISVAERIALGRVIVRIISNGNSQHLIEELRERRIGLTVVDGHGAKGEVKMLFSVVNRADLPELVKVINSWNPAAFYSIEEVKVAREGVFRPGGSFMDIVGLSSRKMK